MPFEEIPHAADWSLRVQAEDLPSLFAESARGMNALTGAQPVPGPRMARAFEAEAQDAESLLVAFLSELVYAAEQEKTVFDQLEIQLEGLKIKVVMFGAPILSMNKTIKAVTYHNLKIRQTKQGYEVEIVFDV